MERFGYNIFKVVGMIRKFWQGKLSGEELEEYERMKQITGLQKYAGEYENPSQVAARLNSPSRFDEDEAYRIFLQRTRKNDRHTWRYMRIAAAVVLPLLVGAGIWLIYSSEEHPLPLSDEITKMAPKAMITLADGSKVALDANSRDISEKDGTLIRQHEGQLVYNGQASMEQGENIYNELTVPRGGEYLLTLADGTKIWLNAGSRLKYPVCFKEGIRKVFLSGEAYFDVSHDAKRPFIVSTSLGGINVMGTEFNVRDYEDEGQVVTTLVDGIIGYSDKQRQYQDIILKPGQQVRATRSGGAPEVVEVDAYEFSSWKDGIYVFNKERLEDMMKTIERNYDVNVFFNGEQLKGLRFSGKLKKYERIEQFLGFIETGGDVTFSVKNRTITVNPK